MPRLRPFVLAALLLCAGVAGGAQRELLETTRFPSSPGKKVVVDAAALAVSLRGADVPEIAVTTDLRISGVNAERAEEWVQQHTPESLDGSDQLTVRVRPGHSGFLWLGHLTARARLAVVAPLAAIPDVTTTSGAIEVRGDFADARPLRLRTATGDMEMMGAAPGLDIRSTSGSARVELVRPSERLFARTSSGDVILVGGSREVEVETSSGTVWMSNLSGSARVTTSNGKVTLRWDRLPDGSNVVVRSASGKVQIVLPAGARPAGTLRTTTGSILCDLPGTVNAEADTVTLEGTGAVLDVESTSGEIIVTLAE